MTRYELWHWHMIMIMMICEWISQDQNIQEIHRKQPFQFVGTPPERSQWPRAVPSHGSFVAWSDIWTSALAHGGSWSSWESARGFCPVLSILRERERDYHVVLIRYYNYKCYSFFFDENCFGIVAPSWLRQRHLSLWGNLCKTTALVHSLTSRELPRTCALDSWDCSCGWAMQGASLQGWKKSADLRDDVNPCHCHLSQPLHFLRTYIHPSIHTYIHTYVRPSVRTYIPTYISYHTIPYPSTSKDLENLGFPGCT